MAENDQNMNRLVRKILENWIMDMTTVDNVAMEIVSAAHSYIYREIMDFVRSMQFRGNCKFFLCFTVAL
jgi:hypothetical protein